MAPANRIKNLLGHLQNLVGKTKLPDDPHLATLCEKFRRHNKKQILAQPIEESRFVIIDTETTGFHVYAGDEMISIAMLEYKGLSATGREYLQLINPQRPIPQESTAIHGISDDEVANSPPISDILPDIAEFIGDAVLIGHHINFDIRFLNKYFKREIRCQLRNPYLDTMLLFTSHTGRIGQYSLEEVAACCKIKVVDRHTAKGDALMAGGIFTCLAPMLSSPHDDVNHLYNQQFGNEPIKHEIIP
ncbi:MAG: 3'-5' exonuclease [Halobacteria archaeon]|nr:3'-5' exonuclease [Halobacteria archaeon]